MAERCSIAHDPAALILNIMLAGRPRGRLLLLAGCWLAATSWLRARALVSRSLPALCLPRRLARPAVRGCVAQSEDHARTIERGSNKQAGGRASAQLRIVRRDSYCSSLFLSTLSSLAGEEGGAGRRDARSHQHQIGAQPSSKRTTASKESEDQPPASTPPRAHAVAQPPGPTKKIAPPERPSGAQAMHESIMARCALAAAAPPCIGAHYQPPRLS